MKFFYNSTFIATPVRLKASAEKGVISTINFAPVSL